MRLFKNLGFWGVLLAFSFCGCVGLMFQQGPVQFDDPAARLGIVSREPTPEEAAGITLRFLSPPGGISSAVEKTVMFAQIKNTNGLKVEMIRRQKDHYQPIEGTSHFLLKSETLIENGGGNMLEETEISDRGGIVKFIRGFHKSKIGTFQVEAWSRTPLFPEGPVKAGDTWNYEESLSLHLQSKLVKQKNPTPYVTRATSKLTGFATVKDRPVAVIQTRSSQTKQETIKILFKTITMNIQATIDETEYFDWKNGATVAKVTKTSSFSSTPKGEFTDTGESQSIYELTDSNQLPPSE